MSRVILTLLLALASAWLAPAKADDILSAPYVRTCNGTIHAWLYARTASGVVHAPGPSCPASASCLSPAQIGAKALELMSAANPASAAASANSAALAFECGPAIRAEQTWRGALCRERWAFVQAHLPDIGLTPLEPQAEPSCTPPAPAPQVYVVSGSQAFPLTASGARSYTAWPIAPIRGDPCDPSVTVTSFGATFMKVPMLSTANQVVVAGCSLRK